MTYFEKSGEYTICSIGGPFGDPNALYEAAHLKENIAVNLPTTEAAREVCRLHAKERKVAA